MVTGAGLLARFLPPDVWWPPSIIALLLPGLLLFTLLFFLFCLYRKWRKTAVFPCLILIAALPITTRLFSFGTGNSEASLNAEDITIMTANVRGYKNDIWESVDEELAFRFIRDRKPTILLLQETRHEKFADSYVDNLKEASGLKKRHQPANSKVATYADQPVFIADRFVSRGRYNGFLVTDVETRIGTVRIINAHLQSNRISAMAEEIGKDGDVKEEIDRAESMLRSYGASAAIRASQAEEIRRFIRESPYPVIVGGDFNDVPSSYTYQRILTPRLKDAWVENGFGLGTTFTGPLPGLRIDFLLVDTSLTIKEIERINTGFSDHRGLKVVVQ